MNDNKKQTTVEWLEDKVMNGFITPEDIEEAKEMEKQIIDEAWEDGYKDGFDEGQWENSRQYLSGQHYSCENFQK